MWQRYGVTFTVCLACSATLLGHAWLAWHHERRVAALIEPSDESGPMWSWGAPPSPDEVMLSLPDETSSAVHLLRRLFTANYETSSFESDEPADALRPATPARPLTRRQLDDQAAVRDVIEEEMLETSAEERDIWFDELKSLPAEAVRDLLKVRKQLRVLSPDHQLSGPSELFPMNPTRAVPFPGNEIPAESIAQTHPVRTGDWSETRQALVQAMAWSTHNLANAATPGYKRIEVVLGDSYGQQGHPDESPLQATGLIGRGCRLTSVRLDMSVGELRKTGRKLDLAIDGAGFLIVQHTRYGFCYARCGTVTLNQQGQLCLATEERSLLLDPPIALPSDVLQIAISDDGVVSYTVPNENTPVKAGCIKLARVTDPSRLIPLGNSLYAAPDSEPVVSTPGTTGLGIVRQGFLEQSNVNPEREELKRQTWETILRSLPSLEIPRTAREGKHSPN